ncbi:MAG: toxic anion resistance protein [Oscillospiraceae bacterium]|nr:toxic anion resistance protein [Oscillospiraceae bacterium]
MTMELTLTPNLDAITPEAPTAEDIIEIPSPEEAVAVYEELAKLSEEERQMVQSFSEQIDITNTNMVLHYGASAQKHIADFSSSTLGNIRSKDMGDVGGMLSNLTVELRGFNFDDDEKKGVRGLFRRATNKLATLKAQFDTAEKNVDRIVAALENHQVTLLKDVAMLDRMYELNKEYFKELTMYILAGKQKLQDVQQNELKALQAKAIESGLPEDAQAANDMANMVNRFEKKIHDLELTRVISIQMAPQIRMIQNNDALMLEKIQTSIVNTIPLWKSQMVLAVSLHHSQQAMQAQRSVNDTTNELLRRNAEKLKTGTVEIAKEAERSIVDLETLQQTNQNLIETLEEVRVVQIEGAKRREEASVELGKIEGELKQKLLEISTRER